MANPPGAPSSAGPHRRNRILGALPHPVLDALAPHLATVPLRRNDVLAEEHAAVGHVHFPHSGVVSLTLAMETGQVVEAATIGPEGIVGIGAVLGQGRALARNVVQVDGEASRMEARRMAAALEAHPPLRRLVFRYLGAFVAQALRAAACNALHTPEERAARWLLMTQDRVGRDDFDLTQEFLAEMLGVRRATVNQVGRRLQQAGLVDYRRGRIRILDRAGLEAVSCECYAATRRALDEAVEP